MRPVKSRISTGSVATGKDAAGELVQKGLQVRAPQPLPFCRTDSSPAACVTGESVRFVASPDSVASTASALSSHFHSRDSRQNRSPVRSLRSNPFVSAAKLTDVQRQQSGVEPILSILHYIGTLVRSL
ncbi:hypothetical protein J6590_062379 [Homalodisca vitripennis]|nr:hypothetical protein J6590_062379 [Homalodisca vitripennis]